jgi:hypothetical protein
MVESSDAVLAYWNEHRQQFRQSEDQRSTMTNFLLVITAGLSGLIVQQKLSPTVAPLALLIILIGLYGALVSAKYHERAQYHLTQARALTKVLLELDMLPEDQQIIEFREAHYRTYPRLHRVRLHWLWTGRASSCNSGIRNCAHHYYRRPTCIIGAGPVLGV